MVLLDFPDVYLDTSPLINHQDYEFTAISKLFQRDKYFSMHELKDWWRVYISKLENEYYTKFLNLYIHIPFCVQRCYACPYYFMTKNTDAELKHYLDYLEHSLAFFKEVFANVEFNNLFIGGGTPSIFKYDDLERLLKLLGMFSFDKYGEKTFECTPSTMDEKKDKNT